MFYWRLLCESKVSELGSTEQPPAPKYIKDSADFVAEIIGENALYGSPMPPGAVLDMVDILAGRVAVRHSGSMVATVAFDRVEFHSPIYHQDLIQAQGHILSVGSSSMVVKISVYRYDIPSREFQLVQTSYVTMVALLQQGTPNKNIPGLIYTPEEEHFKVEAVQRKELSQRWLTEQLNANGISQTLSVAEVETEENRTKADHLTIAQTEITIRHTFMPRSLNMNSTVFGGEVLLLMHRVAVQCARAFTRNPKVITKSMNRVTFRKHLLSADSVEMVSRVVFVNKTYVEIEIEVQVTRWKTMETFASHNGYFTISNRDENDQPQEITTGLLLRDNDQESLQRYWKARLRQQFWEPAAENEELATQAREHPQTTQV